MQQAIAPSVQSQPTTLPALSEHKAARFAAVIILYFMQGVPVGLGLIAVPAWLAANGATPVQVGAMVATSFLPWTLKLVNGLIMDRFAFKPMGRRRGWILAAQALMTLTLITLAVAAPGPQEIFAITVFLFVLNVCATFNDVAVDGMVVDVAPEAERPLLNSLMFAGQAFGFAATGFIAGVFLAEGSIATVGATLGGFVLVASTFVALFRERPGERLLPWTSGEASIECIERQQGAMWPIIKGVVVSTFKPLTLLFLIAMSLAMGTGSYIDAVASTLSVQQLGWSSDEYSGFTSAISLVAAILCVVLGAPTVKAFGLRNALILVFCLHIAAASFGAATLSGWDGNNLFALTAFLQLLAHMFTLVFGCVWLMHLCDPKIAASQFALFNAVPALVRGFYAGGSGFVIEWGGYQAIFVAIAALASLGLVVLIFARVGDASELPDAAAAKI
ncbi:MAG: MFS transporter [Pseudomonadota bacterium]